MANAVVTTEFKGVFFGELVEHNIIAKTAILKDAQMAVYWPVSNHGVLGLAKDGPKRNAKISPPVPLISLNAVTAVMTATEEAAREWKKQPWD